MSDLLLHSLRNQLSRAAKETADELVEEFSVRLKAKCDDIFRCIHIDLITEVDVRQAENRFVLVMTEDRDGIY